LKQQCLTIWDIPSERILDSSFWILLLRMQVYPSKKHVNNAELLYTKLLPSLNSRPLLANVALGQQTNLPTQYDNSNRIDGKTSPGVSNQKLKRMKKKLLCANTASLLRTRTRRYQRIPNQ